MGAMGAQALAALREPTADIRLVTEQGKTPAPAVQALPAGWQRPEVFAAQEVIELRERVRELNVEVAHLKRQLTAEREAGRREEHAVAARTMGGKVLSIFVGVER